MNKEEKDAIKYAVSTNKLEEQEITEDEKNVIISSIQEKTSSKEFLKTVKEMIKVTKEEKRVEENDENRKRFTKL